MTYTNFLPQGFESLQQTKDYIELGNKMPDGEYKYRIVMRPIGGWRYWGTDGKPVRSRPENKPIIPKDPKNPLKSFWALYVWDYKREDLFILEATQVAIISALKDLATNEDWGDLTTFDIKLKKQGSGMDTEYAITPVPHKPMEQCIKDALREKPVRLEALYDCGNPWEDLEPSAPAISDFMALTDSQHAHIDSLLEKVGDEKFKGELATNFKVTSIYNIHANEFERAIRSIEDRIKSKNKEKSHESRPMARMA